MFLENNIVPNKVPGKDFEYIGIEMIATPKRKIHLLSITGEPCQKCQQNHPWTYRVKIEDLISAIYSKDEIRCEDCVQAESLKSDTLIYDNLKKIYLTPSEPPHT